MKQNNLISIPPENLPALNPETNIKLVTYILDCMYNHDNVGTKRTNHSGWQSRYTHELNHISRHPEIMRLVDTKILDYVRLWISSHEPRMPEMHLTSYGWFNVNFKNDLNVPHNHINPVNSNYSENIEYSNPLFSGCYYIQIPDGEENSFYFTPEYETLHLWFKKDFREFIHTQTGDINLFYPNINHGVVPNKSDHPRITYSFNVHIHSNQP